MALRAPSFALATAGQVVKAVRGDHGVDVDVDGQPLSDDDVDGESLAEDDVDGEALGRGDV